MKNTLGGATSVAAPTTITCRNALGKPITLPIDYLWRALQDGRALQTMGGEEMTIAKAPPMLMLIISTNFRSWHQFTVAPDSMLQLWAGGEVRAAEAKGKQLIGEYGMYEVRGMSSIVTPAYVGNFQIVGGIYVDKYTGRGRG